MSKLCLLCSEGKEEDGKAFDYETPIRNAVTFLSQNTSTSLFCPKSTSISQGAAQLRHDLCRALCLSMHPGAIV